MSPALIEKPEALYPGAPVLLTRFARGQETGDVRVQDPSGRNQNRKAHRLLTARQTACPGRSGAG